MQSPVELSHFITVRKNLAVALCPKDTFAGVLLSHLPRILSARCCLIVEGRAALEDLTARQSYFAVRCSRYPRTAWRSTMC